MGELQIEVLRERLLREYKLDVFIGPLRVCCFSLLKNYINLKISYRESPTKSAEYICSIEDSLSHKMQRSWNSIKFYIQPLTKCDISILQCGGVPFQGVKFSREIFIKSYFQGRNIIGIRKYRRSRGCTSNTFITSRVT